MQRGALAVALYFALAAGVGWLHYGIAAWVWSMLALTVWTVPAAASRRAAAVPPIATTAFDLAVLAALFLAHWYWTAFAFAAWCGCLAIMQARRTS